jgi:hypothetical protein
LARESVNLFMCREGSTIKGDFLAFFYVHYSTLLNLPPLRFHCAGGCWDRTQDCSALALTSRRLTTRLDLIHSRLDLIHTQLDLNHSRLDLIHCTLYIPKFNNALPPKKLKVQIRRNLYFSLRVAGVQTAQGTYTSVHKYLL